MAIEEGLGRSKPAVPEMPRHLNCRTCGRASEETGWAALMPTVRLGGAKISMAGAGEQAAVCLDSPTSMCRGLYSVLYGVRA